MSSFQSRTLQQIRQSVGLNGNPPIVIVSTATANGANSNIIDTYGLKRGGDDEYNGHQVIIISGTVANIGLKRWVTDFTGSTSMANISPVLTNASYSGDGYEMWKSPHTVEQINDVINQAVIEVSGLCLQERQTVNTWTEWDRYEYPTLAGFKGVHSVEYVSKIGTGEVLHECDEAWTAGISEVTASLDDEKKRRGSYCVKLVLSDAVAASARLGYKDITQTDISNYDTVELWVLSTIDVAAGGLVFLLDNTSGCVSAVESINLPALTAGVWKRCELTLANPHLDTAIISIGLKEGTGTDIGACTLWLDYVLALKSTSRVYSLMPNSYWELVRGSTNYLKLTPQGMGLARNDTLLRISGYQLPTLLTTDSATAEIDPDYLIARASGIVHKSDFWLQIAESKKPRISTSLAQDTRLI